MSTQAPRPRVGELTNEESQITARKLGGPVLIALAIGIFINIAPVTAGSHEATFDRLKALEGEWEARDEKGNLKMRTVYETVAGGQSLMERLYPGEPGHADMMSVYHMDGEDLIITHYCMAGNQPTMVATVSGDRITFKFQRATNLASMSDGHMGGLKVTFQDKDHFTQEWMWVEDGEEKPNLMEYTRVR